MNGKLASCACVCALIGGTIAPYRFKMNRFPYRYVNMWICIFDFDMNSVRSTDFIHLQHDCIDAQKLRLCEGVLRARTNHSI